ncbi:diacylglycerol/lipid kinase family protein [Halobacillus campisalis]|uniref:Diacylglycerol/lipid kinase family protein n=1 Tax=Halobacillus campisalis TaxID=435909 RepID=A0ABW2K2B5_9BACI|nr:diacylglycerol kinase family protein [Halobacillus campisalis]
MYIVLTNPKAGNGKALKVYDSIQKDPRFKRHKCRSFHTEYEGHAELLIQSIASIHYQVIKAVIVIGGDGTIHEVINGLSKHHEIPIALIPAGSGNDFSRGVGIQKQGLELFRHIMDHPDRVSIYPGLIIEHGGEGHTGKYFFNSTGAGLDGEVVHISNDPIFRAKLKKFRLDSLHYVVALVKVLKRYYPIAVEIEIDGKKVKYKRITLVTVTNHPFFGKGMKIAPNADIYSPSFSVIIIQPLAKWKILLLFLSVFLGKHTALKEVHEVTGRSITLKVKEQGVFQVDGQTLKYKECKIEKSQHPRTILIG